jgi:putative membrane protein insertion efficiency factor
MLRRVMIFMIRAYQALVSPLLGPCCRFHPSCSAYCAEAIRKYGAFKGTIMGIQRLSKCHPFHPGGVDLVP